MSFLQEIKALESFTKLPQAHRTLVFYSEGPEYWPHFRGIIDELLRTQRCPFIYVGSSAQDPGLSIRHPLMHTINIGNKGARVNFFEDLSAEICVLTMPDLAQLTLKKSTSCSNYLYLFHSPVSTHMIYNEGAFDHYDTIFTVGRHHEVEIRNREEMLNQPRKNLFNHGYGRLDELLAEVSAKNKALNDKKDAPASILIAPSWSPDGIFETIGGDLVQVLLEAGFRVVARPHPQTIRLNKDKMDALQKKFESHENFSYEADMASKHSFFACDVIISDWSGAALDFAFARLRPVVFIDTPQKIHNPNYENIGVEPIESSIRERIGVILAPNNIAAAPETVRDLIERATAFETAIREERTQCIHNLGASARIAAGELARLAFNASLEDDAAVEDIEIRCKRVAVELIRLCQIDEQTDGTSSREVIASLLHKDGRLGDEQILQLDALTRRIDVFKKIHCFYDPDLGKAVGKKMHAQKEIYPALAYLFIRGAHQIATCDPGRALKFLNAAGNTIDKYLALGGTLGAIAIESLLMRAYDEIKSAS